ncbi:MAG: TetR family transcriptional regulator [Frankiales bacterium]|nr:TetR family transcriptional regulator [Frankiales bacterium]
MTAEVLATEGLLPPGLDLSAAKRKLYEVALELFGQEGYHAVSIRDIATALGQQPSAIYFHVPSKQELLYDLALIGHRSHFESLRDALMDAGSDPVDQLRATVTAHVRVHLDYPSMARLTNRELRALTPDQYASIIGIRSQSEQISVDVIERGVRMGVFHSTDPYLDAKAIGAMGVRLPEWWTPEAPRTKEQILEHYVENALKLVS